MSPSHGLSRVRQRILLGITQDGMDFEKLAENVEVVGPELNYHLIRMNKFGLVDYGVNSSIVSLTEKGKQVAGELRGALATTDQGRSDSPAPTGPS